MVDGMLVCEVWDSLVRPLIEPFDLDCLTALTEDMLLDWPTALSVERDIGDATHYVVVNPEARFVDLADALLLRFSDIDQEGVSSSSSSSSSSTTTTTAAATRFFWIDCFCMPVDRAQRFPARWWHDALRRGLRGIDNLLVVLLDCAPPDDNSSGALSKAQRTGGDGFTRGSECAWRRGGIIEHIECLVPLAIGLEECRGALEVLCDPDQRDALHAALMQDLNGALRSITDRVRSIALADLTKRTRYFQAAGFYVSPRRRRRERKAAAAAAASAERNTAGIRESTFFFDHEYVKKRRRGKKDAAANTNSTIIGGTDGAAAAAAAASAVNDDKSAHPDRHHGIDLAVVSMFRGWILVEAMALLKQNLSKLTVHSKFVGSTDLEELYPFALAMAGHLEAVSVAGGLAPRSARKRAEEVMRLVLDSATHVYGSLSRGRSQWS